MVPKTTERVIRFRFEKTGSLRYISHLDLARTVKSAVRRAGIALAYSHGFNPRPKLVFALPLSVGVESVSEYMDMSVLSDGTPEEFAEKLQQVLPAGITVKEAYEKDADFNKIGWAEYTVTLKYPGASREDADRIARLPDAPMLVQKRTKSTASGYKEADIAPFIRRIHAEYQKEQGEILVTLLLSASKEQYVNPEYVVTVIKERLGRAFDDPFGESVTVCRREMFSEDGVTPFR